ncbi:MAG: hypothetical protein ABR517_04955 [Thermoanaerobaculia bacterium]
MSEPIDAIRLDALLREIGSRARVPARVYLSGDASAVLGGWRDSAPAIALSFEPEEEPLLRALPDMAGRFGAIVDIASPADHFPELPGWRRRSPFITTIGCLDFHHYDFHAQALLAIQRNHDPDIRDVVEMVHRNLIDPPQLRTLFNRIARKLHRHPSIDPPRFQARLEAILETTG